MSAPAETLEWVIANFLKFQDEAFWQTFPYTAEKLALLLLCGR